MKKLDLGQTISVLANVGVLAGIIFLSVEIHQNTLTMRATAIQTAAALSRDQLYTSLMDADISRINEIGAADPSALPPEDVRRFTLAARTFWLGMQSNYRQWALGVLPDEEWGYYSRIICVNYQLPGFYERFQAEREMFIPSFVEVTKLCDPPSGH